MVWRDTDDPPLAQVPLQRRQRSKIEIARENQPHCGCFILHDDQLAVLDLIAQGHHAANPKALLLRRGDLVTNAFAGAADEPRDA